MATKYYVVWQGRKPGIYQDWESCKSQVDKFAGARYKSFKTMAEAQAAFCGKGTASTASSGGAAAATKSRIKSKVSKSPKTWSAREIAAMPIEVKIFADGGCEPNPGKSGSGLALYRDGAISELWYGLHSPNGTNNTAELNAFHQGMIIAKSELEAGKTVAIFCDSKYAIQCVTQWADGWKKKGWTKAGGEIKNLALIKEMYALHQTLKDKLQVMHVNGHVGVEGNELADRMSVLAIKNRATEFMRYDKPLDVGSILAIS